jgi:hypothetical protein
MKRFVLTFLILLGLAAPVARSAGPSAVAPAGAVGSSVGPAGPDQQQIERIRAACLQGRRRICGRILRVLPDGLVVDSGYADLLRPPLEHAWLIPGSVSASRTANLIERQEPDSLCVGVVFLQDLPKAHGPAPKPRQYDYVILLGYPAGYHTYASVGGMKKTVRRFSGSLLKAVNLNLAGPAVSGAVSPVGAK